MTIEINRDYHFSEIRPEDRDSYLEYFNDPSVHAGMLATLLPYTENHFSQWLKIVEETTKTQGTVVQFAIRDKTEKLIGHIDFPGIGVSRLH